MVATGASPIAFGIAILAALVGFPHLGVALSVLMPLLLFQLGGAV